MVKKLGSKKSKTYPLATIAIVFVASLVLGILIGSNSIAPNKNTKTTVSASNPTPTVFLKSEYQHSGILVTYDPTAEASALKGRGFKPYAWYLVADWKDARLFPELNKSKELNIDWNSYCIKPKDFVSDERAGICNSFKGWGYGDSVIVFGEQKGSVLHVDRMEIVSSLLVPTSKSK